MKNSAIKLVWFTTIYAFIFAGLSQITISIPLILGLDSFGIILVLLMVYTVLHDDYKTTKTFKDWYEDHPTKTLEDEED